MNDVLYFAYGSNLLRERLLDRCPNLRFVGGATMPSHRLTFDKRSKDGSGKCAFEPNDGEDVHGVLWSLPADELDLLDRHEGVGFGYERCTVIVSRTDGNKVETVTYRATKRQPGLMPYDWYLALVVAGAMQQELPPHYIDQLRERPAISDGKPERKERQAALRALAASSMLPVLDALIRKAKPLY